MPKGFRTVLMVCAAALFLPSCTGLMAGVSAATGIRPKHVNVLNASYAAADTLSVRTQQTFRRDRILVIRNFEEVTHKYIDSMDEKKTERTVAFPYLGLALTNQIRERFQQLGYKVVNQPPYGAADYGEVYGVYEVINRDLNVSLRFYDRKDGTLLSLYDYTLPVTAEVRRYMPNDPAPLPALDKTGWPDVGIDHSRL